jgi:hypothetical protein
MCVYLVQIAASRLFGLLACAARISHKDQQCRSDMPYMTVICAEEHTHALVSCHGILHQCAPALTWSHIPDGRIHHTCPVRPTIPVTCPRKSQVKEEMILACSKEAATASSILGPLTYPYAHLHVRTHTRTQGLSYSYPAISGYHWIPEL